MRGSKRERSALSGSRQTNSGRGRHLIICRHVTIPVKSRAELKPFVGANLACSRPAQTNRKLTVHGLNIRCDADRNAAREAELLLVRLVIYT